MRQEKLKRKNRSRNLSTARRSPVTMMATRAAVTSIVTAPASLTTKMAKRYVKQPCGDLKMSQVTTPVGPLSLGTSNDGLKLAYFDSWWEDKELATDIGHEAADVIMREAKVQVQEYFAGQRTEFTIPLVPEGTSFQRKAWEALSKIQYGETICYDEQATSMDEPGKARAVGAANGKNPICLFIPCHRVIAKGGGLCGYAFGLEAKEYLLNLESRVKMGV